MQSELVVEPTTALLVPGGHWMQADDEFAPIVDENVPALHGVHAAAAPVLKSPAEHWMHAEEVTEPTSGLYRPALQPLHLESPVTSPVVPGGHSKHADAPVDGAYWPRPHGVHAELVVPVLDA